MRMKTWMRDMTTNLMLTMITNTLVSVFIFAIFAVFCDADRQETASDVNVAGMVLIPADGMPQWLMRIGLASGYRQKPSGKNPHVAVSSAHLKPSTLQMEVLKMSSIISKISRRIASSGAGAGQTTPCSCGWRTVMQRFHSTPASSADFGASRHFDYEIET